MAGSLKPTDSDTALPDAGTMLHIGGQTSLSRGWKRWHRHLRCTIAAYLPEPLLHTIEYKPQQTTRINWDAEYAGGHWDYLRSSGEIARYGVIASFCHCYTQGGALLDHGCGEGILRRHLNLDFFNGYTGIDLSLDAIAKAGHHHGGERTRFLVGDVETYQPEQTFDVIVFNEMLYYLQDPGSVLQRQRSFLSPNGVFVVSMFDMIKARKIWQVLNQQHQLLESSRAVNQGGHSWTIRVYKPGA